MRTLPGLAGRTILCGNADIVLAEMVDGEQEAVEEHRDHSFDPDPDGRPVPFQIDRFGAAILDARTGELLGRLTWRPIPYAPILSCTTWNIGINLLPAARGRGLAAPAGLLLARYLFETTGVERVQACTDVENVPGWRGLDKAGFHREGVLRGCTKRGERRQDMVLYSLLRSDLAPERGSRRVLRQRDGVQLVRPRPDDRARVRAASDHTFTPDRDEVLTESSPATGLRGTLLAAGTGRLLGVASWHGVDYGGTLGCLAWRIELELVPDAHGVAAVAHRLLVEHLFASTDQDRIEAAADVDNRAGARALEEAGFRHEGVVRGALLRGGRRRDVALYGILRPRDN
ncbi:MAG TPA: GNAT family protein [Actinophytocola sp.]|uniref:GNAT family N-acetyltransferase n=1 Tax=Actinophytocola sp. TaxID=1872138 RepID=UPI002DBB785E|nr:GNAT family protein [Actinophytocola sp.]HEU5474250.1 GNAT family protein [Actinophytocola sp.]